MIKLAGSVSYQGFPCVRGEFTLTPGMTPDSGQVLMLIRNFERTRLEIERPMFSSQREETAPDASLISVAAGVINGEELVLRQSGSLNFQSALGGVTLTDVYIREDGLEEVTRFPSEVGTPGPVSLVRVQLVDERDWWGRLGFVFGVFNKRGVDSGIVDATRNPQTNKPWTIWELTKLGVANLPSRHVTFGGIYLTGEAEKELPTLSMIAQFRNPADFLEQIARDTHTIPVLTRGHKFEFWSLGRLRGDLPTIDPKYIVSEQRILLPDYSPDQVLVHAEHPTIVQEELTLLPREHMMLRDPRNNQLRVWTDVLGFYGMSHFDLYRILSIPNVDASGRREKMQDTIEKYLRTRRIPGDVISPQWAELLPEDAIKAEAAMRASYLFEDAGRKFRIQEKDFSKLPLFEMLLQEREADITPKTSTPDEDENDAIIVSAPIRATFLNGIVEVIDPKKVDPNSTVAPFHNFSNPSSTTTLEAGAGAFSMDTRVGVIRFQEPIGQFYFETPDGSRIMPLPPRVADVPLPWDRNYMKENLFRIPPERLALTVAYTRRGNRDIRESPGKRSRIPAEIQEANLSHVESMEDYYLVAYTPQGEVPVDKVGFPALAQVEGGRYIDVRNAVTAGAIAKANTKLKEDARKLSKGLFNPDRMYKGYVLEAAGFYGVDPDGVIMQVGWSVDTDGYARTTVVAGSPRSLGRGPNLAQKQSAWNAQRLGFVRHIPRITDVFEGHP